ncbi:TPA: hypothetical protein L9L49_001128 [Klebsiella quasipneumoniae subsp. quasipneumoniae]|nr:hypothetical protein [Klebsiella quasipneumoniae subsp. quasipneumoniae]
MKNKFIALLVIISPLTAFAERGDSVCKMMIEQGFRDTITTPAITGSIQDTPSDLAICYQGKDYSQEIAKSTLLKKLTGEGMRVVSSSNVKGFREMYVSLYNIASGESVITRVSINKTNKIWAYPGGLVSRQQITNSDPEGKFFFIPSYKTDVVYFNFIEPTRVGLYRFHHIPGNPNGAAKLEKVSDGYGEWVKENGDIIISKDTIVQGKGREIYGEIISPSGKEKCKLDASEKSWVLSALSKCQ